MAGFVKAFGVTFDFALYEVSYSNIMMYCATLPTYNSKSSDKDDKRSGSKQKTVQADDPKNRELVRAIIGGYKF